MDTSWDNDIKQWNAFKELNTSMVSNDTALHTHIKALRKKVNTGKNDTESLKTDVKTLQT